MFLILDFVEPEIFSWQHCTLLGNPIIPSSRVYKLSPSKFSQDINPKAFDRRILLCTALSLSLTVSTFVLALSFLSPSLNRTYTHTHSNCLLSLSFLAFAFAFAFALVYLVQCVQLRFGFISCRCPLALAQAFSVWGFECIWAAANKNRTVCAQKQTINIWKLVDVALWKSENWAWTVQDI